ncbi:MAG: phosphate signaling complex protein PhoU [Deltaproteobacteria bacterium]|jgi:phosphate transport system protein|nr:phosphate signaling complex protein PhoU [Deltaproteobacteria bacterium]
MFTLNDKEINNIKVKLAIMSQLMSGMFNDAVNSLFNNDRDQAKAIIKQDEQVDALETEIEGLCLRFLALYAPKAFELRYVVAVTRLTNDIERIADHSTVICREVLTHHFRSVQTFHPKISQMTEMCSRVLGEAVDSFFDLNDEKFKQIFGTDKSIGEIQKSINSDLTNFISRDPDSALETISLINIVRRLERVADHAKNIAVMVPYITQGKLLRHSPEALTDADTVD